MTMAAANTTARVLTMNTPFIRLATLVLASVCTIFWLSVAHQSVADAIPLAKGVHLARWTTLAFLLAVLPALVLATCNVAVRVALVLAAVAAVICGAVFLVYLPAPVLTSSVVWLSALFFVVLGATYALFGLPIPTRPEQTFEQAQMRLAVLYVSGLATVLWLSSFAPIIQYAGRGGGFEVIPAFLATPPFMIVVVPLLVIGLRGKEPRYPELLGGVTFLTFVTTAIFGVPQLIG